MGSIQSTECCKLWPVFHFRFGPITQPFKTFQIYQIDQENSIKLVGITNSLSFDQLLAVSSDRNYKVGV